MILGGVVLCFVAQSALDVWSSGGIVPLVAVQLVAMSSSAALLLRDRGGFLAVAPMSLAALAATFAGSQDVTSGTGGDANVAFLIVSVHGYLAAALLRPAAAIAVILAVTATYSFVFDDARSITDTALEFLTVLTAALAAGLLAESARRASARADQAAHTSLIAQRALTSRTAADAASTETRRLMHDHLIAALSLIATGAAPEHTRAASRAALTALKDGTGRSARAVRELAKHSLGIDVIEVPGPLEHLDLDVPPMVRDAVADATLEALRNVARHAGTDHARVEVEHASAGLVVRIIDDGDGFAVGDQLSFGIRMSIQSRMAEVGGSATIDSTPGSGTTVTLRWAAPAKAHRGPERRWRSLQDALGSVGPIVVAFPLAELISQVAMMLALPGPRPVVSIAFGTCAIIACLALLWQVWHAPLRRWMVLACMAATPVAVVVGLYLAGPGALHGFDSWIVGVAGVPIFVLCFVGPVTAALVTVAGVFSAIWMMASLDPTLGVGDATAPLSQTLLHAGIAFGTAFVILRFGAATRRNHATIVAQYLATEHERSRRGLLAAIDHDVLVILERAAAGAIDPQDRQAAKTADVMARRLRDEILAPGLITPTTRRVVDAARTRGVSIDIRAGRRSVDVGQFLETVLGRLLPHVDDDAVVVVTPSASVADAAVVSVRPPLDTDLEFAHPVHAVNVVTRAGTTLISDAQSAR